MMNDQNTQYYDEKYFQWQKSMGKFAGWANRVMFEEFITPKSKVLDYGCGGGYLIKALTCKKKVGLEINHEAAQTAAKNGVEVYTNIDDIPDGYVDRIISNNALEHTLNPLDELTRLLKKIEKGGLSIFVVPCEAISWAYKPGDINQHLYSWSPMSLGNLFTKAGYRVIESRPFIHKWPPFYKEIAKITPFKLFHLLCKVYGHIERSWFQVRVIAKHI